VVSSRYSLTNAPAQQPAEDLITRSTVGPFVDTGAWTVPGPHRRRIYLSVETIAELAEAAGVFKPVQNLELLLANARAEGAMAVMKENLGGDLARILVRVGDLLLAPGGVGDLEDEQDAGGPVGGAGDSGDGNNGG
jgi:hypothetical protein